MNLEQKLLAQMADVVIVVDGAGHYTDVSPSVAGYGFDPTSMIGRSNIDLTHPDDRLQLRQVMRDLLAGRLDQNTDREYRVMLPDGRQIWVEGLPSLRFDDRGDAIGYLTVLRDVTNRRAGLAQAAEDAARRLLNHDIRTPLNGILTACELFKTTASRDVGPLVDDIATSAEALRRAVEAFLGAAHSAHGGDLVEPSDPLGAMADRA